MNDLELALAIDAVARENDPLARFVEALSDPMRAFAKETIRLRDELVQHTQALLTETPQRATLHAEWIARHAHEVAYRWSSLAESASRWAMYDVRPIRVSLAVRAT